MNTTDLLKYTKQFPQVVVRLNSFLLSQFRELNGNSIHELVKLFSVKIMDHPSMYTV